RALSEPACHFELWAAESCVSQSSDSGITCARHTRKGLSSSGDFGQRLYCGTVEHLSIGRELGPMTGAVPAFFERVPMNDAGHVRAARRSARDRSVVRLVAGELERTLAQDCALTCRDLVNRTDLRWTDILGQILDNPGLPADELPERRAGGQRLA